MWLPDSILYFIHFFRVTTEEGKSVPVQAFSCDSSGGAHLAARFDRQVLAKAQDRGAYSCSYGSDEGGFCTSP